MMRIITVTFIIAINFSWLDRAFASVSLGCESEDHQLKVVSDPYYEGGGLLGIFDKYKIFYGQQELLTGLLTLHSTTENDFKLKIISLSGTIFNLHGKKIEEGKSDVGTTYVSDDSFIVIDGKKIDLKGVIFECIAG